MLCSFSPFLLSVQPHPNDGAVHIQGGDLSGNIFTDISSDVFPW